MKKKSTWIILGLLALILMGVYAYLGGFRSFEITLSEREDYQLVGHYYAGEYRSDSLKTLFFDAKKLITNGILEGNLAIAHFSPVEEQDSISVFIGVAVRNESTQSPPNLEQRTIKAGKVIRANITAHSFVRPLRNKVDKRMEAFAHERGLTLRPIVLEHYLSEDELYIDRIAQ